MKRLPRFWRIALSLLLLLLLFFFTENQAQTPFELSENPSLYANQCQDDLEKMYLQAIQQAEHSIFLIIYSLTDMPIVKALNTKAAEGVDIRVVYDRSTPSYGFDKLHPKIHKEGVKLSGLMHEKILVIDASHLWIGSANLTRDSLKLNDNLVIGFIDVPFARAIEEGLPYSHVDFQEQHLDFWRLPKNGKEALQEIIHVIDRATTSLRVAMFTWTHPSLTEAVLRAYNRGVDVEIVLDNDQTQVVNQKAFDALLAGGINVRLSPGPGLMHHKFAWIDKTLLINGSANWTRAAFTRNQDCFFILSPLTQEQIEKMERVWEATFAPAHPQKLDLAA